MALSDNMRGAGLMVASMTAFTINDMFVKLLGDHLPFFQFLLLRTIGASFFLFLLARRAGAIRSRSRQAPGRSSRASTRP